MDLEILKKKLSTFKTEGGRITKVSDDLLLEVLHSWEHWTGPAEEFYRGIGSRRNKMSRMLGKAKQLKREGHSSPFQEMAVDGVTMSDGAPTLICDIEVQDKNKIIRFRKVDLLIEYLKKAA